MTDIVIKRGTGKPDSLLEGELAIDTSTGRLYSLVGGVVTELNEPPEDVDLLWTDDGDGNISYTSGTVDAPRLISSQINMWSGGVFYFNSTVQFNEIDNNGDPIGGPPKLQIRGDGVRSWNPIQATDFLDADGNSIVGTGGALPEGYYNGQILTYRKDSESWDAEPSFRVSDSKVSIYGQNEPDTLTIWGAREFTLLGSDASIIGGTEGVGGSGLKFVPNLILPVDEDTKLPMDDKISFGNPSYQFKDAHFSGNVQAADFLDADGNSIVGGGGESLWRYVADFDASDDPTWNYYKDLFTAAYFLSTEANQDEGVAGTWYDDTISVGKVKSIAVGERGLTAFYGNSILLESGFDPGMEKPRIQIQGPIYSNQNYTIENTVIGGINITGAEADRPPELPFSADEKSVQYALSVTHQTLGRTVEIDKEGTIRARAFADMDGNPIGGSGGDGNIADGTQDGTVATWDSTANSGAGQWTPDSSLTIDATGDATFSGTVLADKAGLAVENYGDIIKAGTSSRGLWLGASNRSTSRAHTVGTISAPDAQPSAGISFRVGGDADADEKMFLDASGDATFSGTLDAGDMRITSTKIHRTDDNGSGLYFLGAMIRPVDKDGTETSGELSLGANANKFKDAYFSGTVNAEAATFSGRVSAVRMELGANAEAMHYVEDSRVILRTRDSNGDNSAYFGWYKVPGKPENCFYGTTNRLRIGAGGYRETTGMTIDDAGNLVVQGNITKNGTTPVASTVDIIKTLSTLRQATMDETRDIRESLRSAIDELVEGFEQEIAAMPAGDES